MIEIESITKIYNVGDVTENAVFRDFSLTVPDGEFVSVVGSNGSGKTTLLNLLCGSVLPQSGKIRIDGTDVTTLPEYKRYRNIGRVYQNPALGSCATLTVMENMALADKKGRKFGLGRGVNTARAAFYREKLATLGLGLEDKTEVPVGALSGGQRQALTLLMAAMTPLRFLILDEHTAALDPKTADVIMELTDRIVKEANLTALMVTHNLRYAVEYGTRMLMLHEGRIVLDRSGEEKKKTKVGDVLHIFNEIAVECGS